jgi:hypothetical protein
MPNKEIFQYDLASSKELLRTTIQSLQRMTTTSQNSYREKVVRELIETEQTYLKGIQTLIEVLDVWLLNLTYIVLPIAFTKGF